MYYEPCTTESLKECIVLGCLKYAFGNKAGVLKMGENLEKKSEDNVVYLLMIHILIGTIYNLNL